MPSVEAQRVGAGLGESFIDPGGGDALGIHGIRLMFCPGRGQHLSVKIQSFVEHKLSVRKTTQLWPCSLRFTNTCGWPSQ